MFLLSGRSGSVVRGVYGAASASVAACRFLLRLLLRCGGRPGFGGAALVEGIAGPGVVGAVALGQVVRRRSLFPGLELPGKHGGRAWGLASLLRLLGHPVSLRLRIGHGVDVGRRLVPAGNRPSAAAIQVSARGNASSGRARWGFRMRFGRAGWKGYARLTSYGVQAGPVEGATGGLVLT